MGATCRNISPDRPAPKEIELGTADPILALAHKQAKHIKKIKSKEVKREQIVLLCETWKKAIAGGEK